MVVFVLASLVAVPLLAQSGPDRFAGRRLDQALRLLQARGVRVVFSSELVTPGMRVTSEPPTGDSLRQLREMLAPHGLTAEKGPGGVIQVVRKTKRAGEGTRQAPLPIRPTSRGRPAPVSAFEPTYRERLTVTASGLYPGEISTGAGRHLGSGELRALAGSIADDPLRLVQALPGVAAGDDFRSEYSVRGSAYRHAAVVIDGVAAPWLQHRAMGRGDTGTLTMVSGDLVQDARLMVGAYPRQDGGQIGPQLQLMLREGSRATRAVGGSVSGTTAMVTAEGPLGESERGSWIAGVRRSHVEWPVGRDDHEASVFDFTDLQSKLVYDVRPEQQISVSIVAGLSNIDRDAPDAVAPAGGLNRASLASLAWRSLIAPHTAVTQRVSLLTHDFVNRNRSARPINEGEDGAVAYRVDVTQAAFGGVVEAGGQFRQLRGSRRGPMSAAAADESSAPGVSAGGLEAVWLERSSHASFRISPVPGVTLLAGLRAADSTLVRRAAVDRWLGAEWAPTPGWLLHGSTGTVHQFPALDDLRGWTSAPDLRPERATHLDIGIARHLAGSFHFDATVFARRERDTLRDPHTLLPPGDGLLVERPSTRRFEDACSGAASGIELTLERRSHGPLSGWLGYSYGVARYTDEVRGDTFDADQDQRHAINLSGSAALPGSTTLGVVFRAGTNFPIPGYLVARDGRLFAGDRRNQTRLPAYARVDVRAERGFQHAGRRFVLFAEALNVLNRANVGLADGRFLQDTGEAVGVTERLFPRLMTAGIRFDFGRSPRP